MATNHLEDLVAEWYEYNGYFIRRNVKVGRLARGGYEGELDIVAFNPTTKHLVHVEPSLDANSWAERERRYAKKFEAGRKYVKKLFDGLDVPDEPEQIALFVFAAKKTRTTLAGGKVMHVSELLAQIFDKLKTQSIYRNMVDEQKPLLRTLQFVVEYKDVLLGTQSAGGHPPTP